MTLLGVLSPLSFPVSLWQVHMPLQLKKRDPIEYYVELKGYGGAAGGVMFKALDST